MRWEPCKPTLGEIMQAIGEALFSALVASALVGGVLTIGVARGWW